jgi:hypothetical protein
MVLSWYGLFLLDSFYRGKINSDSKAIFFS